MIYVKLLSEPEVFIEGEQIQFPYKKVEGLFYYICYEKRITRDKAASLLWADNDEQTARKNLRNALYQIRKTLGNEVIHQQGHTVIELNQDMVSVDIDQLNEANIVDYYHDSFLGSHYIKNSLEYESWVEQVKYHYQQMCTSCMANRMSVLRMQPDLNKVDQLMDKALALTILDEKIYRNAMMIYFESGAYNEAIRIYKNLKGILMRELECEPERVTQNLFEEINNTNGTVVPEGSKDSSTYFFGRQNELHHLISSSQSVLVQGEAGVGKTSLISRYLERIDLDNINVIEYKCHQSGMMLPYRPVFDICEAIQQLLKDPMDLEQILNAMNGDQVRYPVKLEFFMEGLIHKVVQRTGKKLLLVIDDWQWIDGDSAELMGNLIHHMQNKEVRFLIASRDEHLNVLRKFAVPLIRNNLMKHIVLEPFSKEDTDRIIREKGVDMIVDPATVQSIYKMTGGNAFFLMEILNQIRENGNQVLGDRLLYSPSVKNILDSRLFELDEDKRRILDVLSCQTDFLTMRELQKVLAFSEQELVDALEQFIGMRLICEEETFCGTGYVFIHSLIQDYVYREMTSAKKTLIHRQLAEGIEATMGNEVRIYPYLIYHYRACGNIVKMYAYKLEYFIKYYSHQHEVYPQQPEYFEGVTPWTQQLINDTAVDDLVKEIRVMTETTEEEALLLLRMKSEFLYGRYAIYRCDYHEGLEAIGICQELSVKLSQPSYQFLCYLQLIFYSIQVGDYDMMKEYVDKIADDSQDSYMNRFTYLRLSGLYYLKMESYEEAERRFYEAIEMIGRFTPASLSRGIGSAVCYSYIGEIHFKKKDYDQAQCFFERAIEEGGSSHDTNGNGIFYVNMMKIMYEKKAYDKVKHYAEYAKAAFARAGAVWGLDEMNVLLCAVAFQEEDYEGAASYLSRAKTYGERTRYPKSLHNIKALEQCLIQEGKGVEPDVIL